MILAQGLLPQHTSLGFQNLLVRGTGCIAHLRRKENISVKLGHLTEILGLWKVNTINAKM